MLYNPAWDLGPGHGRLWPIATATSADHRRFQSIADMDRFSSRNDLQPGVPATPWLPKPPFRERLPLGHPDEDGDAFWRRGG
jgi:hypothetical protein